MIIVAINFRQNFSIANIFPVEFSFIITDAFQATVRRSVQHHNFDLILLLFTFTIIMYISFLQFILFVMIFVVDRLYHSWTCNEHSVTISRHNKLDCDWSIRDFCPFIYKQLHKGWRGSTKHDES